jgi:multicomponent Na+:H+ antiporter subunit E
MNKLLRFAATALISFVIYLLLTASVALPEILFGIGVALIAALLVGRYLPIRIGALNPVRIVKAAVYLPIFLWKMIEANLKLALIVLRPSLPIAPSIVKGKTGLNSGEGKLFLTSSITLTPGTLTVDVEGDDIYVHCVTAKGGERDRTEETILVPFEKRLKGVTE